MKLTPENGYILLKRAEIADAKSVLGVSTVAAYEVVEGAPTEYEEGVYVVTTEPPIEIALGAERFYLIEPEKIGGVIHV